MASRSITIHLDKGTAEPYVILSSLHLYYTILQWDPTFKKCYYKASNLLLNNHGMKGKESGGRIVYIAVNGWHGLQVILQPYKETQ